MGFLYQPEDGFAGDFIPFYWQGDFHLFFLKDYRDPPGHGEGVPWFHLVTKDFVTFDDWGEALPRGTADEPDLFVFTGCVVERQGTFHIFYVGSNPYFRKAGRPEQVILHATSPDLRTWHKDPAFNVYSPGEPDYEIHDWRDPFVFWNAEAGEYWMLVTARKNSGPTRQRGLITCLTSADLQHWAMRGPFWAPDLYINHECSDLFRIGDWWYLLYSTYSERWVTHYRLSQDLAGPWLAPANDTFDARSFYAAKTSTDGQRRFLSGWLPTRKDEKDDGEWQWGGSLVVHELVPLPDGRLAVKPPDTVVGAFGTRHPLQPKAMLGRWQVEGEHISGGAVGQGATLLLADLPETGLIEADVSFTHATGAFGFLLRADEALEHYYVVRFEPARQRVVFDRWPRPGDQPFILEQPVVLTADEPLHVRLLIDGTCAVVYAGDQTVLSGRMYEHRAGQLGLFANEGAASFAAITLATRG